MAKYIMTYDIITQESAEDGDTAEHGWIDSAGTQWPLCDLDGYHPDMLARAGAGEFDQKNTVAFIVQKIKDDGMRWTGGWFSSGPERNIYSGDETTYHLHVHHKAVESVRRIVDKKLPVIELFEL